VIPSKSNLFTLGAALLLVSFAAACTDDVEAAAESRALRTGAVYLGTAGNFAILSKTGITSVPPAAVTGDIGVSPIAATAITGFALTADSTNVFSTSAQVTGEVYAANYAAPTPADLTAAIGDMQHAFTDAAGRAPNVTELGAGKLGGKALIPGVYKWSTGVQIPTSLTLTGSATSVWIFEIAQGLTLNSGATIILKGGGAPRERLLASRRRRRARLDSHLEGIVLAKTAITLAAKASVHGRLLSQTAVTLINNTVVEPTL